MSKKDFEKKSQSNKTNQLLNNNDNIQKINEKFSFLELDKYLNKDSNNSDNIKTCKKNFSKKEYENVKNLKIKPNANIARMQTEDETEYFDLKNEGEQEEKQIIEDKNEKNNKIIKQGEKESLKKKKNQKEQKIQDKRIVKINIEQSKKEEENNLSKKNLNELNNDKKVISNDKISDQKRYDIESIIKNIKDKEPMAYTPILLPFLCEEDNKFKNEDNIRNEFFNKDNNLNENRIYIIQFPRQIPIKNLHNQIKTKEEENVIEEPNYDENGFLITPEFKNSFKEIKNNTVIGKMVVYKCGKVKMKMGEINFDINQGSLAKFAQQTAIIPSDGNNQAFLLVSPYNRKLIVTPGFE